MADDIKENNNIIEIDNKIKEFKYEIDRTLNTATFSITNIRTFLTILSFILTVFALIAGWFGIKGVSGMIEMNKNNEELENKIKDTVNKVHNLIGIYIVSDIQDKDITKPIYFKDLKTIKNEKLPEFKQPPKIIMNYTQGGGCEIEKITEKYIKIKNSHVLVDGSFGEINETKIDLWIAEY